MSWLFSQALVEEYLGENFLAGEQSVLLNGNPTQQAYLSQDKMTKFSKLSRFGMTFKPLTESLGEDLLMLYLVDSHAKTLVQQEKEQELMESVPECGEKWQGSFVKYSQDTLSWKTHQCSLLGGLDEFSETWPQWGLMRNGECWEQQTLEQTTKGIEFGSLANKWPTPTVMDSITRSKESWEKAQFRPKQGRNLIKLGDIQYWPTPQASDNRDRGNMSNPSIQRRIAIGKQIMLSQSVDPTSGALNPTWVEWLMGWPLEWTDLKPLETDKFHCAQQQHGEF